MNAKVAEAIKQLKMHTTVTVYSIWSKHSAHDVVKSYSVVVDRQDDVNAMLEQVFEMGNIGTVAHENRCPSISVGDFMLVYGDFYYVDSCGFKKVEEAAFDHAVANLTSRELAFGYDYATKHDYL